VPPLVGHGRSAANKSSCLTAYAPPWPCYSITRASTFYWGPTLSGTDPGLDTTIPVTLDAVIPTTRVRDRGANRALVVRTCVLLTYQVSAEEALRNAAEASS